MANDRSKICEHVCEREVMSEHKNQAQIGEVLSTIANLYGHGSTRGVSVRGGRRGLD